MDDGICDKSGKGTIIRQYHLNLDLSSFESKEVGHKHVIDSQAFCLSVCHLYCLVICSHSPDSCEILRAMDLPMNVPNDKPSAALFAPHYFWGTSLALTQNTLWVMLASGMLLVFQIDDLGSATVLSCRQAHQGPGLLYGMDTSSILSMGLPVEDNSWLTLAQHGSDALPRPDKEELVLLQWELQQSKD